jgi:hypothetical protein
VKEGGEMAKVVQVKMKDGAELSPDPVTERAAAIAARAERIREANRRRREENSANERARFTFASALASRVWPVHDLAATAGEEAGSLKVEFSEATFALVLDGLDAELSIVRFDVCGTAELGCWLEHDGDRIAADVACEMVLEQAEAHLDPDAE